MIALFLRITKSAALGLDKHAAIRREVSLLRQGAQGPLTYLVDPTLLEKLDETPFCFWAEPILERIDELRLLEPSLAAVRRGGCTGNDARWLRLWFEVPPGKIGLTDGYVPFAKGGVFAPYYSDISLVAAWDAERRTFRGFHGRPGRWTALPEAVDFYFRPGLTYPRRADSFNVRAMPAGCAFGDKGPSIFADDASMLPTLLGVLNSTMATYCSELRSPRADSYAGGMSKSFEVGSVQKLPVPNRIDAAVGECATGLFDLHRRGARFRETTHDFVAPLLSNAPIGLQVAWEAEVAYQTGPHTARMASLKKELDERVFDLYGLSPAERTKVIEDVAQSKINNNTLLADDDQDEETEDDEAQERGNDPDGGGEEASPQRAAEALLSYAVGCAFGRWDVRIGQNHDRAPKHGGPFDSLPQCSPGMLVDSDGLPPKVVPHGYPIAFPEDGVLVDDKNHPRDLVQRVGDVFGLLYGAAGEERLSEALSLAGAPDGDMRVWLRTRFFERVHRPMYTTGGNPPRRAPVYWPIYVKAKNRQPAFGVWLYYHRLTYDSLFTVARILGERRSMEKIAVERLAIAASDAKGRASREANDARAQSEDFMRNLVKLEEEALRIANLRAVPDFDDGVLLNCGVLHDLVAWSDAEAAWTRFQAGAYDWSNIAKKLRTPEAEAFQLRERALADAALSKPRRQVAERKKGRKR